MKVKLSHTQIIALGFFILIIAGALLLCLPAASRDNTATPFTTSLFTATSATCVTGLVVVDTATHWSILGQLVIITLIQIGGLGFMTISTMFFMLMRRRVGLRQREVMVESLNTLQVGGIMRLTKHIIAGTAIFELTGAALLSIRFVPMFGVAKGIYFGLFHSVSAFCNAGFDLMGVVEPYSSLSVFADDPLVNITVMVLIVVGGLGFIVWDDIFTTHLRSRRYKLQTRVVLAVTAVLIFGGALLLWIFERSNTEAGMPFGEQVLVSLFGSVTARTAGFNTTDTASLTYASKLLTMILMMIGGSPGSTAGGIKTTTLAVIFAFSVCGIRRERYPHLFGRRLEDDSLGKAVSVLLFNFSLAMTGTLIICAVQNLDLTDVLFEVFSAIGTVGMSAGATRELCTISQYVIIALMYLGRVGSISFANALLEKRAVPPVTFPTEKLTIG